jgi:hypothetical protein
MRNQATGKEWFMAQDVPVISPPAKRQRPLFLLAVPLILGCVLVSLVLIIISRLALKPSDWRAQTDYYMRYKGGVAFVSATQATRPEAFTRDLRGATYGNSATYATDFSYSGQVVGQKPLLYPPDQVWCVILQPEAGPTPAAGSSSGQRVVFVARHIDMYNADWVTHEPKGDAAAIMTRIGCR